MCLVNGHPAKTLYHSQPRSLISRHYARSIGLKVSSSLTTLFVAISIAASIRTSSASSMFTYDPLSVGITEDSFADIVLGNDWMAVCQAAARGGGVVFAPYTHEAQFNVVNDIIPSLYDDEITPETLSPTPQGEPALRDEYELPALQVESVIKMSVHQTETLNESSALQAEPLNELFASPSKSVNDSAPELSSLNIGGPTVRHIADPYVSLSLEDKVAVVRFLAVTRNASIKVLQQCVPRHQNLSRRTADRQEKKAAELRRDFESHQCTNSCLILRSEAIQAGINGKRILSSTELQECSLVLNLYAKGKKRKHPVAEGQSQKKARTSSEGPSPETPVFPRILLQSEKDQIIHEFRESTNNEALKRYECSFCGKLELAIDVRMRPVEELDISVLNHAVQNLRESSRQPRIEVFRPSTLIDGRSYVLCHLCNLSVSHNKFQTLPLRSYANGLWIGDVPLELQGLTFLEEQCIARARATRCMYKIKLVCVILVASPETEVTQSMLQKSPLLVHRQKVKQALFWLIENNPLYGDLKKDSVVANLEEYPEYDCPLAVKDFLRTNSATNQGSSYTEQANAEIFDLTNPFELTATTLVDADNLESTYKQRKL
ncbi:hypothetical protein R3P38DRAFT_2647059, partial [Favolaschia claudopus]